MSAEYYIKEFLRKRGYETEEEQANFLNFREEDLRSVEDMIGGRELLSELREAVCNRKHITVYGDYDADGILSTCIFYSALERLSPGRVHYFINDRFEDGYSITEDTMKKMLEALPETEVILTCDNGVNAVEAAAYARSAGITVLVTDHHEQSETTQLPEEIPALDEKSVRQKEKDQAEGVKREDFCGAELARRVIHALYKMFPDAPDDEAYLAFSGCAQITDSVPVNPANHYIMQRGLAVMRKDEGIWKLLHEVCGLQRRADGYTIGFHYGPTINACGRVTGSANKVMEALLLSSEPEKCREALRELRTLNEVRKEMCTRNDELAFSLIRERNLQKDPFIFLYDESFDEGINGLTASHVTERFGVPSAVLSPLKNDPAAFKGSARSVETFDLFQNLSSHPEKIKAGGHPMAAGLTVKREDLEEVRRLLIADAEKAKKEAEEKERREAEEAEKAEKASGESEGQGAPEKTLQQEEEETDKKAAAKKKSLFDFGFRTQQLSLQIVEDLQEMQRSLDPFGPGLEPPRIALQGRVSRLFALHGKDGSERHAKFVMQETAADGSRVEVLWWNKIEQARKA
ncbi:MAG: DHH family phosphoesterase, partial [Eubacterium sp.]|nr:DHH family phosphoesterase [Eubacterium sp.]